VPVSLSKADHNDKLKSLLQKSKYHLVQQVVLLISTLPPRSPRLLRAAHELERYNPTECAARQRFITCVLGQNWNSTDLKSVVSLIQWSVVVRPKVKNHLCETGGLSTFARGS